MGTLYDASGKPIEVPDDKVTKALLSGQYKTDKPTVTVRSGSGEVFTGPVSGLAKFAATDPSLHVMSDAEVAAHEQQKQNEAFNAAHPITAPINAVASGAMGSLPGKLASYIPSVAAEKYLLEKSGISTEEEREAAAKANAGLAKAGNIGGEALFALGTGGLTEGIERGGAALASKLVGTGAEGIAGLAQRGITRAVGQAAAGSAYSVAMDLGENAVSSDHQLTGEQILHHAGIGALLGGGIGLGGELGSSAIERLLKTSGEGEGMQGLVDRVSKEAAEIQFSATGAKAKEIRALENSGLDAERLGRWQLDELPKFAKKGESIYTREGIQAAAQNAMDDAVPKMAEHITQADRAVAEGVARAPAWEPIANRLRSDVVEPLLHDVNPTVQGVGKHIAQLVDNAGAKMGETPTFEDLWGLRKEIDKGIKFSAKDPTQLSTNAQLRQVRSVIEDEIEKAGGLAMGEQWTKGYQAAKTQYRMGASVDSASESAAQRMAGNNKASLSDYLVGGHTMAGLLAAGHPHALLAGAVAAVGHHLLKTHGDAVGSRLLDGFVKSGAVQRLIAPQLAARAAVDAQHGYQAAVIKSVQALMRGVAEKAGPGRPVSADSDFDRKATAVKAMLQQPQLFTQAVDAHAAALGPGMPSVASSYQSAAMTAGTVLAQALPRPRPIDPAQPKAGSIEPTASQKAQFSAVFDAVQNPRTLLHRATKGTLTHAEVAAVAQTSPGTLKDMQKKVTLALLGSKRALDPPAAAAVKMLLGQPVFQAPAMPSAGPVAGGPAPHKSRGGGKAMKLDVDSTTGLVGHRVGSTA